jgi:hypothetical protein
MHKITNGHMKTHLIHYITGYRIINNVENIDTRFTLNRCTFSTINPYQNVILIINF